jgi:hypothetical protein
VIPRLLAAVAWAQDEAPPPPEPDEEPAPEHDDDILSPYRTRFDVLAERAIGTTSQPVEFNWRRTTAQVALTGSYLVELNNFNAMRIGAVGRFPTGGSIVEIGATYAGSWDSTSSRQLALTPYRQPGHPDHVEVDATLGVPLAEGVVTAFPRFFPAVEMVFNFYGGLRYIVYPSGWGHMKPGEVAGAIFNPTLTEIELENLEDQRLDAMEIDAGRYGLLAGLGNDLYFKSGFFVSPRFMLAVPLLAPASQTELPLWADLSLALGMAF